MDHQLIEVRRFSRDAGRVWALVIREKGVVSS